MTPEITYECQIPEGAMPRLCKVIKFGEAVVETALNPDNKEEFASITDEKVIEHINNLVEYIKQRVPTMVITPINQSPTDTWPLTGFKSVADAAMLLDKWWWAAHTREEEEGHDHDHGTDAV